MDFKFSDDIMEAEELEDMKRKRIKLLPLLIFVFSLTALISTIIFVVVSSNKKDTDLPPEKISTQLSLKDENVKILYSYVTDISSSIRSNKFLKEEKVTPESFTDEEKLKTALLFIEEKDLKLKEDSTENTTKTYVISSTKITECMKRYFGSSISYNKDTKTDYIFDFTVDSLNIANINYSSENNNYEVVFTGLKENTISEDIIEPYYTKLVSASKKLDGTYELVEKVIYTEIDEGEQIIDPQGKEPPKNTYTVGIYSDYLHMKLIESRYNQTREDLFENPVNINKYIDKAGEVTYTFKPNNNVLYFYSSEIN